MTYQMKFKLWINVATRNVKARKIMWRECIGNKDILSSILYKHSYHQLSYLERSSMAPSLHLYQRSNPPTVTVQSQFSVLSNQLKHDSVHTFQSRFSALNNISTAMESWLDRRFKSNPRVSTFIFFLSSESGTLNAYWLYFFVYTDTNTELICGTTLSYIHIYDYIKEHRWQLFKHLVEIKLLFGWDL